jgi:hypothetical protein
MLHQSPCLDCILESNLIKPYIPECCSQVLHIWEVLGSDIDLESGYPD